MSTITPWWQDHRKQRYKNHQRLSTEMIIRKSIVDTAKDYLKNCSLPGVRKICDATTSMKTRIFWTTVFFGAFLIVIHYSITFIFSNSYTKPFIVAQKSFTYSIRKIDFPAVALCNANRISKKALNKRAEETYKSLNRNTSLDSIKQYYMDMEKLITFEYNKEPIYKKSVSVLSSWIINNNISIVELMKEMAPNCEEMLLKCSWDGHVIDCKDLFHVRRTFRGHCCVFNYVADLDSADKASRGSSPIKKQVVPGSKFGLYVIVDPLLEDYTFPSESQAGVEGYINLRKYGENAEHPVLIRSQSTPSSSSSSLTTPSLNVV